MGIKKQKRIRDDGLVLKLKKELRIKLNNKELTMHDYVKKIKEYKKFINYYNANIY